MRCAGILLTGGASTRMGQDKATLPVDPDDQEFPSTTLAAQAAAALAAVTAPTLEVGPGVSGLPNVADDLAHQGPLVALATGLGALGPADQPGHRAHPGHPDQPGHAEQADRRDASGPVLLVACDLPLVGAPLLAWLVNHPAPGSVVPLTGDPPRPQPLCARWSPGALGAVDGLIARGERSLRPLLAADVTFVRADAWMEAAGLAGCHALDDADTPAELARLRALRRAPPAHVVRRPGGHLGPSRP